MWTQEEMQATYKLEYLIEIMFDQIERIQELSVTGNSPFSNRQLAGMRVPKILSTEEYTHAYRMWKSIAADNWTWVRFR